MKRALAVLGLVAVACAPAPPRPTITASSHGASPAAAGATTESFRITDQDVEAVVRAVSVGRQLVPTRKVKIAWVEPAHFLDHLFESEGASGAPDGSLGGDTAFLLGFNFLPQPGQRAKVASTREVLTEQVAGYYSHRSDQVFLPTTALRSHDDLLQQRAVLAHEVHHAFQAQHFKSILDAPEKSSDEAMAHLALIEGDAQVAMAAAVGSEQGVPVGRTLRRLFEAIKNVPLSAVTRGERREKLDQALGVTRARLAFPYEAGMMFVSDIYRAGGFPLVDKLYERPPVSTEQVLHPAKYVAGESPRPIRDPKPPPGYSVAKVDTLGELDARALLGRCVSAAEAERAAEGWSGDRYGVFVGPERHLAVLWISAWDSEDDAKEVESALTHDPSCWQNNALGLSTGDYVVGSEVVVRRSGRLVAFGRGLPAGAGEATALGLFRLVGPAPAPSPLAGVKIPPRVALPEPRNGRLEGDVYTNEWLGMTGRVPPGMLGEIGTDFDFKVQRTDVLVRGVLAMSFRIASDEQNEKTFLEAEKLVASEAAKADRGVDRLGGGAVQTPLGNAIERTWRIEGSEIEARVLLLPICAGTGSVIFLQVYGDPYARSVLDGWLSSFRWLHGRSLTACDYLDPK